MKILVAGDWHSELHEDTVYRALAAQGHETHRFGWHQYFEPAGGSCPAKGFSGRLQNKLIAGPRVVRLNADFLRAVRSLAPDAVFIYRGTHITPHTLKKIREELPRTVLVGYNNDDPFAPGHFPLLWRHFLASVPLYDLMLAYRLHNLEDFRRAGARRVELLRSWFVPERNRPLELTSGERKRYGCDVVFAGHYEPDGRLALIERIVREGFHFRLFGPEWDRVARRSHLLKTLEPVRALNVDEYGRALCGAKIALCMFSTLNRDTYTRRCFEIPAAGTFMLAQHSEDLATMFREGEEVAFFRNEEELVTKLRYYLAHPEERMRVAQAGYCRVVEDGHDLYSRTRMVTGWIEEVRA